MASLLEGEEVFTSPTVRPSQTMNIVLSSPGPLGEESQALSSDREEAKKDSALQFGGRLSDSYDHLIPLKGC